MSTSIIMPGEGYDQESIYTEPVLGNYNGIYESRCHWPFVEVQVRYTEITITDPIPAKPGQPYIPPTLPKEDLNENAGWGNSSARSAQPLLRSQRFKTNPGFDIRGFFVGLAIYGKEKSHPSVFPVGLSCIQAGVFVVEHGSVKSSLSASINPDDEISIEFYSNGSIVYRHSNGSSYYSSASVGNPVYVYAQGYQAQDVLLSSLIEDFISYDPTPSAFAAQESIGTAGASAGTVPAVLAVQETGGTAGVKTEAAPAAFVVQESIGSAGVDVEAAPAALAVQESVGSAGTDAETAPAVLAAQETFGMARDSFPAPAAFAAQESVGLAGIEFFALQESAGIANPDRAFAVQETVGSAIPCFFNPIPEIAAIQESVGEAGADAEAAPDALAVQETVGIGGDFLAVQESAGIANPDRALAVQESIGSAGADAEAAPDASAVQESIGSAGTDAEATPAVLAAQETVGVAGADAEAVPVALTIQESIGSAGVDADSVPSTLVMQETVGEAGTDAEAAPAVLAAQETFGMARNSFPVPAAFAAQESVGVAGHFLAAQETVGMTGSGRILAVQETVGSAIPCFFNPVPEIAAIQESVGEADEKYNLHCNIFGECLTVAGLSNDDYCAISGKNPCGDAFINNDDIPPRLNSAGFLIMPDDGAIDGGGMIETCEIFAEDYIRSSLSDVDNYCAIGGFDGAQKAELKNSPAGYLWTDDIIKIKESSSFLRDVLIGLYSSLEFVDGLNVFKDIAVGLIENNLIYDANDIVADKDILLEETCNLLDSLKININGLPDYTGGTAWVINMETGATSLFLDYDYNSFMTSQSGEVYGICNDGIYLLNGAGASAPMSAIDYGIHRFGSETKKMIPHFYASVASTGRLILKLAVGECEYEYYAMSSSEYLDKHRIDIGKGIGVGKRFIYANPVLIAPEGTEIKELEILEYLPVTFDRRK